MQMKLIAFICPLLLIIEINAFAQIQKQEQTIYEPTVAELTKRLKQTRKEVIEIHAEAIKIAEEVIKIEEENKKLIDKNKILAGQAKAEKAKNQLYLASLREANAKIKELEAVNNALRAKINTLTDKATAITERAVLIESRYKEKQFADSLRISTLETNASRLNETIEDLSRQVNDLSWFGNYLTKSYICVLFF